jgi:hypothetical protein
MNYEIIALELRALAEEHGNRADKLEKGSPLHVSLTGRGLILADLALAMHRVDKKLEGK